MIVTQCINYSSLRDTVLDGQTISCFSVGGEDRLCLTQLLQLVLHDIPLARIHQVDCIEHNFYMESLDIHLDIEFDNFMYV